jgi:hypothetical protein
MIAESYAELVEATRAEGEGLVLVEREAAHAVVTLNDPEKLNPLSAELTSRWWARPRSSGAFGRLALTSSRVDRRGGRSGGCSGWAAARALPPLTPPSAAPSLAGQTSDRSYRPGHLHPQRRAPPTSKRDARRGPGLVPVDAQKR